MLKNVEQNQHINIHLKWDIFIFMDRLYKTEMLNVLLEQHDFDGDLEEEKIKTNERKTLFRKSIVEKKEKKHFFYNMSRRISRANHTVSLVALIKSQITFGSASKKKNEKKQTI